MSYNYATERPFILTDSGQRLFLELRDHTDNLLRAAGAMTMARAMAGKTGDNWRLMACIDRRVELGELVEIHQPTCSAQERIFVPRRMK